MSLQGQSGIQNFKEKNDLFADDELSSTTGSATENLIHVRIQQRNGRKTLTTVQGVDEKYDLKKLLSYWKKQFSTNGTVVENDTHGDIIQLQGDQRNEVADSLVKMKLAKPDSVKVHGF